MESKNVDNDENCVICLQPKSSEAVETLPCAHVFHVSCVTHWFETSRSHKCPICRTNADGVEDEVIGSQGIQNRNYEDEIEDLLLATGDIDSHFGRFETSDGDSVYIYESPLGIVMIRTINIPEGMRLLSLPTGNSQNTMEYRPLYMPLRRFTPRRRVRRFFSRVWQFIKNLLRRPTAETLV